MAVGIYRCTNAKEVLNALDTELNKQGGLLPVNLDASIVIKPNLNSSLDALTGNTTDLRVLGSILRILTNRGYKNITILEGPNGGFHRDGVDVLARNRVDKLVSYYGCKFRDVNYDENTFALEFESSGQIQISRAFKDCDFFINIPKLKTHYETVISVSLKSLIGILVGQSNKAKAHTSLCENILRINDVIVPHLHVVDGLIAMEGTGPSAGIPVRANVVMVGTNAYEVDIHAARLMGFNPMDIPLIRHALATGRIAENLVSQSNEAIQPLLGRPFKKPHPSLLARLATAPGVGQIVRKLRNTMPVSKLLDLEVARKSLLHLGVTQEVILRRERQASLKWRAEACTSCGRCATYCPQSLDLPKILNLKQSDCINCLYCFAVCPVSAIEAIGDLGYYREQIRRYGKCIKDIA